ncbi:uncharacterized protein LOC135386187 [Ornithodoros turicata]|uniref:uncharacterized protein LOC135386187 n=1 Tax=Ornithodoros turicata TaxID=34597 RepID=UPI003139EDE6
MTATTAFPSPATSRLFFVVDRSSKTRFLVDTGAAVSVLPASSSDRRGNAIYHLMAVNNSAIPVYHEKLLTLNLGLRKVFPWVFRVAAVSHAILGADFLHHFALSVDVSRRLLVDTQTRLSAHAIPAAPHLAAGVSGTSLPPTSLPISELLRQFPTLTQPPDWTKSVKHDVVHFIETTGPPVFSRSRQLSPEKLKIGKAEFQHMLDIGIARPSSASWSSALHMVPKKTGGRAETTAPST